MRQLRPLLRTVFFVALLTAFATQPSFARGQRGGPGAGGGPGGGPPPPPPGAPGRGRGASMPPGKWWDKSDIVKKLKLKNDQRKKMDEVFQEMRGKLMEWNIAVDKEEAALEPLMEANPLDDAKILPQIDRIAQTRAELEKAEARLVLGLRHVLTQEQWKILQSESEPPDPRRR